MGDSQLAGQLEQAIAMLRESDRQYRQELLKQLRCLQFEQMAGGGTRIAVPERLGHDDIGDCVGVGDHCGDASRSAAG